MIENFPNFIKFHRLYWNQMANEIYGSFNNCVDVFVDESTPDMLLLILSEIKRIDRQKYRNWLSNHSYSKKMVQLLGGNSVNVEQLNQFEKVLQQRLKSK